MITIVTYAELLKLYTATIFFTAQLIGNYQRRTGAGFTFAICTITGVTTAYTLTRT